MRPYLPPVSHRTSIILWLLALTIFPLSLQMLMLNKIILLNWEFMLPNSAPLSILLMMDPKGMIFSSVVLFISANVLQFSNCYMSEEKYINRFTHLVILFVMSMNLLIYIPHLIALLLGWDGLGIVSFLLVAFYQNPKSLGAAMITALSNRIGDVLILLSIGWALNQGHWNLLTMWHNPYSNIMIISLMIAGMTKSAQMPFSSWLPAAMAAPTPVSALVHSSTLVTAGVFLLIRFYPFLHSFMLFNKAILMIATLTMFMAGSVAMTECDLKKIIALSTLSQLGMMMAAIGLNLPALAFFHLLAHALFKALLFVCAGTLIHYNHHTQDLRQMGNTFPQMPLTSMCMMAANLALCGLPFLAGFYSKDLILEMSLFTPTNLIIIIMFFLATMLTSAYSTRMMIISLWSPHNNGSLHNLSNENNDLTAPALFLSMGAIGGGAMLNWLLMCPMTEPMLSPQQKFLALIVTFIGIFIIWVTMKVPIPSLSLLLPVRFTGPYTKYLYLIASMWFLTPLTSQKILSLPMKTAHTLMKTVDQGWIEILGGKGAFMLASFLSTKTQYLQSNLMTSHLLMSSLLLIPLLLILL